MFAVPTEGPEIDLCRKCQIAWFDAGELKSMPRKTAEEIGRERWAEELRGFQRRRAESAFYDRLIRRHRFGGVLV